MAKILVKDPEIEEEEVATKKTPLKPRRGKLLSEKKPLGASRVLLDSPVTSTRPVNVYKERVTDAESGKTAFYYWWTTENSKTVGKDEIVQVNEKTQNEKTIGFDYTVEANPETKKELLETAYSKTKFYLQDGVDTIEIKDPSKDF